MSLLKDVKFKGTTLNYHKIIKIEFCNYITGVIRFIVGIYSSKQVKEQHQDNFLHQVPYTVKTDKLDLTKDLRAELYGWLKTQDELKDAKDV